MNNIEDLYELSPMQQGMLFHTLYAPESEVYFEQLVCTLSGELHFPGFVQAWQQVVARHPVLRSSFHWEEIDKPLQMVNKQVEIPWLELDWRNLTPDEQQQHLGDFLQSDRQKGFELTQAPLMRFTLIQLGEYTYQFIWSHHHILFDGWSMQIVLQEVLAFYEADHRGEPLRLKPSRPYREYIDWLQQQDISKAKNFWQQTLEGFEAPTPLSVDKWIGDSGQQQTYDEQHFQFSQGLSDKLQSLARQHHLTLNNLVQGAWALLLSRYSGESDVVFGATVSGRPPTLDGVDSMVGLLINTLPIRVQVTGKAELLPWLKHLQTQAFEQQQYAYYSLAEIQRLSDVPPGMPLFESLLVFENYPIDSSGTEIKKNLEISHLYCFERTNYPLSVVVNPQSQLSGRIVYDTSRFEEETIDRMIGHFQTLLEGMATNPQQCISQLSLLSAAEQEQLLVEENNPQTDYIQYKCIHRLFESQVEKTPEAVAVVYEKNHLNYRELNNRANQLAHYLQSLGVKPEVRVGICVERSLLMVVGLLGILKAGGAYLPLDPAYPQERLAFMVTDSRVPVLLTQESLVNSFPQQQAQIICLDRDWQVIAQENSDTPNSKVQLHNLAYVIYTSGSTGKPKGVMIPHHAICNHMLWMQAEFPLTECDRILQKTPFSFDASIWEFYAPLLAGGRLILAQPSGHQDNAYLLDVIAELQVTILQLVPSQLRLLLQEQNIQNCKSLRRVFCGGEALAVDLQEKFFGILPNVELCNFYGPTEATIDTTYWRCQPEDEQRSVPIGSAIANVQIYLLDSHLQLVPVGVPGEIYIGGSGLARGYLNRPELTAEKFIPNPFTSGTRLYKTGDLGRYRPDGTVDFISRIDNQVKLRGFRIELGEVEAVLNQHPSIKQVVVIVQSDRPGDKSLVAYLVAKDNSPTPSTLRNFLKKKLPDYMIPAAFVFLEAFPLTPNGKLNRHALPASDTFQRSLEVDFVAPRTSTEQELASIWAEVLRLKQVGVHDNFLELGGHSLLAIQVISRLREAFSLDFPLRYLFENPTIAELSQKVIAQQLEQSENDALAQILGEVEQLSEKEVTQQLLS